MANITIIGEIQAIRYLPEQGGCFVFMLEYKKGYKRKDGVRVEDKHYQWKVIFKQGLVKYVSDHFASGMVVEVKGEASPFAVVQGQQTEGYTVFGQTMNLFTYPKTSSHLEKRAIKESQMTSSGTPDLESFNQPDF